ncbi:hypothetical protein [Alkalimarinus alittae]|uniref:Uncharacterized protein n=1 Tax=Alkalimarinus alittae TaxID=2961619 RepID=A0ABY6MZL7_9ALTE|nr:hypothetical protein [Alkalimarinus alittae]UZE95291.1 hypothetical protein NKI27_14640 [Alkalimarinus alittae]
MPNLVKTQAKQNLTDQHLYSHAIGKGLGASMFCLAVLAGCASNPEQAQPIEQVESTEKSTTEVVAPPNNPPSTEPVTTEANIDSDTDIIETPDSSDVSTEYTATEAVSGDESSVRSDTTQDSAPDTATTPNVNTLTPTASEAISEPISDANAALTEASDAIATTEVAAVSALNNQASMTESTSPQQISRSSKNLGNSYGIWTLKDAGNGFCKLKTPTLQIGNKEYSSQIWMDIEEQQVVVNAYMSLDITHPKTGIQIDNQALVPFTQKANSTRAIISRDLTSQLASGNVLHVLINGQEIGKKVLKRNVKLTNMNAAITALKSCKQ